MVQKGWIALICLLMIMISACQPTPEANDTKSITEEMLLSGEETPTHFADLFELSDEITLTVDAKIRTPETPLCKASIKRVPFTQTDVQKVAQVLLHDAPIYIWGETKSELMDYYATVMQQQEIAGSALESNSASQIQMILSDIQSQIPNKPDVLETASLAEIFNYPDELIAVDSSRNKKAVFCGRSTDDEGKRNLIFYSDYGFKRHLIDEIEPLQLTEKKAAKLGMEILEKMGIDDMFSVAFTDTVPLNHTIVDRYLTANGYDFPSRHERRIVFFLRKINGAEQLYSEQIRIGATMRDFGEAVFWEYIQMEFDDEGLLYFHWQDPFSVERVTEEVPVMGFYAAYDIFLSHMKNVQNKYTYEVLAEKLLIEDEIDPARISVLVSDIALGMTCAAGENETFEAIPVWEFYGDIQYLTPAGETYYLDLIYDSIATEVPDLNSLCTINALDGKIIDRGVGY